jgi:hypothetical protein
MQVKSLLQLGIDSLYVAMFDEGNEGTAVYKSRLDPLFSKAARFIEADHGCAREEDLYLRLIGEFTRLISVAPE